MGRFDSSKTRVVPVFDHLLQSDSSGTSWIAALLHLGSRVNSAIIPKHPGELVADHPAYWGRKERSLQPPQKLLEWLVQHVSEEAVARSGDQGETLEKRKALANRDPAVLKEALSRLRTGERGRQWFVLEGESFPDAFVETDTLVLVVEGKRTEISTTTKTKWMGRRSQLIRHMDAAWEVAAGRTVLGLLIVEGESKAPMSVPEQWLLASDEQMKPGLLFPSLPHRTKEERQAIANGILGVTTWQRVCNEFSIDWPPVQDSV